MKSNNLELQKTKIDKPEGVYMPLEEILQANGKMLQAGNLSSDKASLQER